MQTNLMITETTSFFYQIKGQSLFILGVFAISENWKHSQLNITYDQLRRRSASVCVMVTVVVISLYTKNDTIHLLLAG